MPTDLKFNLIILIKRMENNNHSIAIPPEVVLSVKEKFAEILDLIAPYSTPLTPRERHDLPSMGEKTLSFVEKALEFADANPALCPNFLDLAAFRNDMSDAIGLRVVRTSSKQAFNLLDDTILLAGSNAYRRALVFYNYIKLLAAQDFPGAKAIYEELKKRFPRRKSQKDVGIENDAE